MRFVEQSPTIKSFKTCFRLMKWTSGKSIKRLDIHTYTYVFPFYSSSIIPVLYLFSSFQIKIFCNDEYWKVTGTGLNTQQMSRRCLLKLRTCTSQKDLLRAQTINLSPFSSLLRNHPNALTAFLNNLNRPKVSTSRYR